MRQTLHILGKDIRRLRYDIIVTLVLTAIFAWCAGHRSPLFDWQTARMNEVAELLEQLLPVAWWYLMARVIHGEQLPGDRQFWVTRPYRWQSLLGAKVLFIAMCVILPLLISDCVVLRLQGFHLSDLLAGIAWHPLVFSVVFLLPVAALACLTVNIAQMALTFLAGIASLVILALFGIRPPTLWFGNLDRIRLSLVFLVVLIGVLTIMLLQYSSRRTGLSRILAGATVGLAMMVGFFLPWTFAFALQSRLVKSRVDTTSIAVQFQAEHRPPARAPEYTSAGIPIRLPIAFPGAPPGMIQIVDGMAGELVLPDGKTSKPLRMTAIEGTKENRWYVMTAEPSLYERVKNTPLRMHLIVLLTLYGNPRTERIPLDGNSHRVPGIGVCATEPSILEPEKFTTLHCLVPFRLPGRALVQFDNWPQVTGYGEMLNSPWPTSIGISPVNKAYWRLPNQAGATAFVFTTMQPLAHIRREIDIPNVRLADYAY
jgi:hypothetical protein